ncbi:hypothetical protein I79_022119 [Cricetulus griseus]|uniref:Uncharacterized protein n=1 Tax=Cricetulus griseus TaxID=10029 RepID=G3IEH2_CRIGR|nr:hypothetical protein I79_022119 [Cricetulus griseus]
MSSHQLHLSFLVLSHIICSDHLLREQLLFQKCQSAAPLASESRLLQPVLQAP